MEISIDTHSTKIQNLSKKLTYLGALPFITAGIICLYFLIFDSSQPVFKIFQIKLMAHTYAVVILSFLSGIYWSLSVHKEQHISFLILSNVLVVVSWLSLILMGKTLAFMILILAFSVALLTDQQAFKNQAVPEWYWNLRVRITSVVVLFLIPVALV